MVPFLAIGGFFLVFLWLMRQREMFVLSVRDGKLLYVRGRIPGSMYHAIQDVVSKPPVERGTVKAYRTPQGATISTSGIDEWREQRLRNVLGTFPISQLSAAPIANQRTIGQVLGIAWLAWLMDRREG